MPFTKSVTTYTHAFSAYLLVGFPTNLALIYFYDPSTAANEGSIYQSLNCFSNIFI